MGNLLSSAFTAMVSPRIAAIRMLHRAENNEDTEHITAPIRASYSAPPPINTPASDIRDIGEATMAYNDIHSH